LQPLSLVRPRQQLTLIATALPSSSTEEEQEPWGNGYATTDSMGWGMPVTADFFGTDLAAILQAQVQR
ncbi:hypothetical protein GIB67_003192, partial [Kingdonia uniflora]